MAGLLDYLDWRGDLTFEEAEFNEVDSLILAWLSYAALDGIVPAECSETDAITIEEATRQFLKTHDAEKILRESVSFTRTSVLLLQKLGATRRFAEVRLTGFVNQIDYKRETQFCAMTVLLKKNRFAVVFRGTDEHLVSWKEDFNMMFLPVVPAQRMALAYLDDVAERMRGKVYVCGHSKGGNLAVYAGVRSSYKVRRKILDIYNFDGPGFYDLMGLGDAYEEMLPKIHSFVPENVVVGMLLEHAGEHVVVRSNGKRLSQHDVMSWEILGPKLVTAESISDSSRVLNGILKNWMKEISSEEREIFVDTLYKILETTQARSVDDLNAEKGRIANVVLKEISGLDKETRSMLGKTIGALFKEGNQAIKQNRNSNKKK
ncbi:MAG: DUF2974 domain-containing protein [Lachnospiraceae bacterium]|nr:DUF2974 domain-containing protein [Lachnospiraceae bacterium]MBP3609911.1 DUF2974 domain-containing protein [Lachnospiraceae bacterium]